MPNKSYTKRLKQTSTGKLLARKPGGNHFNAKEDREKQLGRKKLQNFGMKNKARARFLKSN
jgi:ribosomal protein L35